MNFKPDFAQSYVLLGIALAALEDYKNARSAFDKAINLDANDPVAFLNYAVLLCNMDEYPEAAKRSVL